MLISGTRCGRCRCASIDGLDRCGCALLNNLLTSCNIIDQCEHIHRSLLTITKYSINIESVCRTSFIICAKSEIIGKIASLSFVDNAWSILTDRILSTDHYQRNISRVCTRMHHLCIQLIDIMKTVLIRQTEHDQYSIGPLTELNNNV
jgi:hypothetical protein